MYHISKTTIMKKNLFFAIALACILTSPAFVSCSKELAIEPEEQAPKEEEPGTNPEEVKTRGYWKEGQFVGLKIDEKGIFFISARPKGSVISDKEVLEILNSLDGIEKVEAMPAPMNGIFKVVSTTTPIHPDLYVSYRYQINDDFYNIINPKIFVRLAEGVSVNDFQNRYSEHLNLISEIKNHETIDYYCFGTDFTSSEDVLYLNLKIFEDEDVLWSEPSRFLLGGSLYN